MKKYILILVLIFISCEKKDVNEYRNGGVLPEITEETDGVTLIGTTWVLTKLTKGFVSSLPNDTIIFNKGYYTFNGLDDYNYKYVFTQTMDIGNPYNLILYGFSPFGGNGAWSGILPVTFTNENEINLCEFNNSGTSTIIKASFKQID